MAKKTKKTTKPGTKPSHPKKTWKELYDDITSAGTAHGEETGVAYECGDYLQILYAALELMSQEQVDAMASHWATKDLLENWGNAEA